MNLIIGHIYSVDNCGGNCDSCGSPFFEELIVGRYVGEDALGHAFQIIPIECKGCGRFIIHLHRLFGPINVTEEFSSLKKKE